MKSFLLLSCTTVLFLALSRECTALGEWYCGKSNCYEMLGYAFHSKPTASNECLPIMSIHEIMLNIT